MTEMTMREQFQSIISPTDPAVILRATKRSNGSYIWISRELQPIIDTNMMNVVTTWDSSANYVDYINDPNVIDMRNKLVAAGWVYEDIIVG